MQNVLSSPFWKEVLDKLIQWSVANLPAIVVILLCALLTLKISSVSINKLKKTMLSRAGRRQNENIQEHEKRLETIFGIVRSTVRIAVLSVLAMVLLRKVGVDIAPLIAGAGIIGLAVGFGAQELVRDVISGFFLILENQVRTGDVAVINGTGGLVERIGLRTITLRDLTGTVHIVQNGKINTLSNMTKEWSAMVFDIGVAYKEDTDHVVSVMKTVAEELGNDETFAPKIIEPMEIMGVDSFGDSAVNIKARIKTTPINQWAVGREYRRRLKKAFDAAGIEIPFPHRTIYWGENAMPGAPAQEQAA